MHEKFQVWWFKYTTPFSSVKHFVECIIFLIASCFTPVFDNNRCSVWCELLRNIVNDTVCWHILWHFVCQLWHIVCFVTFRLLDGIKNAVNVQEKWAILDDRRYKTWFYYNTMQHTCAHVVKRSGTLHQLISWNWKKEEQRPIWRITVKSRDRPGDRSDLCSKDPTRKKTPVALRKRS